MCPSRCGGSAPRTVGHRIACLLHVYVQVSKEESIEALGLVSLEGEWVAEFTFLAVDSGVAVEVPPGAVPPPPPAPAAGAASDGSATAAAGEDKCVTPWLLLTRRGGGVLGPKWFPVTALRVCVVRTSRPRAARRMSALALDGHVRPGSVLRAVLVLTKKAGGYLTGSIPSLGQVRWGVLAGCGVGVSWAFGRVCFVAPSLLSKGAPAALLAEGYVWCSVC